MSAPAAPPGAAAKGPGWRARVLRRAGQAQWLVGLPWFVLVAGALVGAWRYTSLALGMAASISALAVAGIVWARWQRERAVREAPLPPFLKRKLREKYPQLTAKDCDLVERGLRQFFYANLRSRGQFVAMPSRVADAMWHEFILHTRAYRDWCELSLGWFLHHTPAEALGARSKGNDGLRRAWFWACRDESIDPRRPTRLPLLFALDAKLGIENGFHYQADCRDIRRKSEQGGDSASGTYCGTDFSGGSYSGDAGGLGGSESSADSWGDGGGGDGGGGCGGGGD